MSSFGEWQRPGEALIKTLKDFTPRALAELRAYYESVDPLRVQVKNIIGQAEYLERLDVSSSLFTSSGGSEQEIYRYLIPGGMLQVDGAIEVKVGGKMTNDTGASQTLRVRIYYDDTVVWDDTSDSLTDSADPRAFGLEFIFGNAGATNSQKMAGKIALSAKGAPTVGYGVFSFLLTNSFEPQVPFVPIGGSSSEDSTVSKALKVTITPSDASVVFEKDYAYTSRIAH